MIISTMLSVFSINHSGYFSKFFCEPSKDDYIILEENKQTKDLDWVSIKEDSKNIQKDYENLRSDMDIALDEYILENGEKKS